MRLKEIFTLSMVFVGTVVGAGFASGLEIWTFFGKYGFWGLFGVLILSGLISLCGCGIFLGIFDGDFTNYPRFCRVIAGKSTGKLFHALGLLFMYAAFCIMLAGSGAMFSQEFGKTYAFGVVFMALLCFFVFLFGIKGLSTVNCILTPLMLIGICLLGISSFITGCTDVALGFSDLLSVSVSAFSAIVYVSYNLLSVPPVLISLKSNISSRKTALYSGLLGGILLGICGLLMYLASISDGFLLTQLPALTLALDINRSFGIFYGIVIFFSMLTTAIGNGYGFMKVISSKFSDVPNYLTATLMCASGSALALLGFSTLVNTLYTLLGYAALLLTLLLSIYSLKKLRTPPARHSSPKGSA